MGKGVEQNESCEETLTKHRVGETVETKLQLIANFYELVSFVKSRVRENRTHGSVRGRYLRNAAEKLG